MGALARLAQPWAAELVGLERKQPATPLAPRRLRLANPLPGLFDSALLSMSQFHQLQRDVGAALAAKPPGIAAAMVAALPFAANPTETKRDAFAESLGASAPACVPWRFWIPRWLPH